VPYRTRDSLRLDMSSLDIAASPPIRRHQTVQISLLLAFAGGYLDVYTWIIRGVMANARTANLVLLWVHGTVGEWDRAVRFVPPIAAFMVGVVVAAWLRRATGDRASAISTLIEILLLVAVGILHNRLPDVAGKLGISFVAAVQTAIFTKVEGVAYGSVMIAGNLRQAIEGLFAVISGQFGSLRRSGTFAALCVALGVALLIVLFPRYVPMRNAHEVTLVSASGLDADFSAVDVACRI
jgi:uncharacterized membrane protein YoaK (UPF0700 family)